MANIGGGITGGGAPRQPIPITSLTAFGHSYLHSGKLVQQGTNLNYQFLNLLASALGIDGLRCINAAYTGGELTIVSRIRGFARLLGDITRQQKSAPFVRNTTGCTLLVFGINDIGDNTPGNQALMRSTFQDCLIACVSKARSAQIFLAQNSGQWAFGTNFANATVAANDYTSGAAKTATVVDAAGTSTATFTIPTGYQGQPICFNMVGLQGGSLIVTWGGTVTGTTGIVGRTDTLSGIAVNAQSAHPVRFTAAVNGLTAGNAGQKITVRVTTVAGSTFTLDGCWIEAIKPAPVLVANVNQLLESSYNIAFGDGATAGATTAFTSATAAFASASDAGQAITETDAQGAFTAGKTVASVTNGTTLVLSAAAAGAFANIKFTLARRIRGYSSGTYFTINTNFSGATIANHAAADADIAALNVTIASVVALFGSMVQIVDLNGAIGSSAALPATTYTLYDQDGLHPSEEGHQRIVQQCLEAIAACRPENDGQPLGPAELAACPSVYAAPDRKPIVSGNVYLPEYTSLSGAAYVAVAGDMFAMPIWVTEPTVIWQASQVEQTNAPATSGSNIRVGWYDDVNCTGYPVALLVEPTSAGAFAMGTTAGVKAPGTFTNQPATPGLHWLVIKIDSLGTTPSQFRTVTGPNRYFCNWTSGGGVQSPIAWRLTGQAAGPLPSVFPAGGGFANSAPALAVLMTVL